jgi:micrococcal nuclease
MVTKISDGDTIWVMDTKGEKFKLRIMGIDTPEKFSSKKLDADVKKCGCTKDEMKELGYKSTEFARQFFPVGSQVEVKDFGKGYYGRTLADVYLDGNSYVENIVMAGYSNLYTYKGRKPNNIDNDTWNRLNRLLDDAKRNGRGLWKDHADIMNCLQ